ncbi:MAG TPA: hypothetical protein VK539_37380 [Myxococcaceae bacterium]|nr:hypothetical protein [Myxococcaceae bacterium]
MELMSQSSALPGLQRLIEVCRRLELKVEMAPPGRTPPLAGMLVAGLPFDRILQTVYAQLGFGAFATDVAGIVVRRYDDTARKVEEDNVWWSQGYRQHLALPTFLFAAEPFTACYYATVPSLADAQGRQPVVMVDVNEEPYALPVASNVDSFFDTYSRYLEALMALPDAREEKGALLTFPWDVPSLIGQDAALVRLLRAGSLTSIMKTTGSTTEWAAQVVATAER